MKPIACVSLLVVACFRECAEGYELPKTRRGFIEWTGAMLVPMSTWLPVVTCPPAALAAASSAVTGPGDGNLPDLPPDAVRSYLQYRIPLQTAADYYVFELQSLLQVRRGLRRSGQAGLCARCVLSPVARTPVLPFQL
jgi:hypothetical protein